MDSFNLGSGTTSRAFEIESWAFVQHKDFALNFLQRADKIPPSHPRIPTTEKQRLAYLRGYVTSPFKLQIYYIQQMNFAGWFMLYVRNVIFRSLPMNYLHAFLAAYSPESHVYMPKMIPLLMGINVQVVLCAIFQLVAWADILTLLFHYCITEFVYQNPLNKCEKSVFNIEPATYSYKCLETSSFMKITKQYPFSNKLTPVSNKIIFYANQYWLKRENDTFIFTAAPMSFFIRQYTRTSVLKYESYEWIAYFAVIWIGAAAFYKQIYNKYIWKTLAIFQRIMLGIYLCILLSLLNAETKPNINVEGISLESVTKLVMDWDVDFFAECLIGPPVIHILLSRSKDQVNPGRDSIVITVNNALSHLFIGLLMYKVKQFSESTVQMPILVSWFNQYPMFYVWAFYFNSMFMGQFFSRIFYIMTFLVEFMLFMITYQLLLETIVCEWQWITRFKATLAVSAAGLITSVCLKSVDKVNLYLVATLTTSVCEAVVVFWLYPTDRLLDDVHFHNGVRLDTFRTWMLRLVPIYYFFKVYKFGSMNKSKTLEIMTTVSIIGTFTNIPMKWFVLLMLFPLLAGAVYAVAKVLVNNQKCGVLLKPRREWGPRDHITRELRKKFDTRDYIVSQASRYLSRHLLDKTRTEVYKLDVRYDFPDVRNRSSSDESD